MFGKSAGSTNSGFPTPSEYAAPALVGCLQSTRRSNTSKYSRRPPAEPSHPLTANPVAVSIHSGRDRAAERQFLTLL